MDKLTPQQADFLQYYLDPTSETYNNALRSALKAGYKQEYAENITHLLPDWLSDAIGEKKKLVEKAKKNLDTFLESQDEKIAQDTTKFVLKTLGKKEGFSEKMETEHTGGITISISKEVADKNQ